MAIQFIGTFFKGGREEHRVSILMLHPLKLICVEEVTDMIINVLTQNTAVMWSLHIGEEAQEEQEVL